jgi:hypothetical protein
MIVIPRCFPPHHSLPSHHHNSRAYVHRLRVTCITQKRTEITPGHPRSEGVNLSHFQRENMPPFFWVTRGEACDAGLVMVIMAVMAVMVMVAVVMVMVVMESRDSDVGWKKNDVAAASARSGVEAHVIKIICCCTAWWWGKTDVKCTSRGTFLFCTLC